MVEDDDFARTLLVTVIEGLGFEVAQASSAAAAATLLPELDLDIALVDLDLGEGPTGVELLADIQREAPWTAGIILTSHRSTSMLEPGAPPPEATFVHLVKADINSADILLTAIDAALARTPFEIQSTTDVAVITRRQAELLRLIAEGRSNDDIALRTDLNARSVERLTARLYKSLRVNANPAINPRVEAARMYAAGKVTIR